MNTLQIIELVLLVGVIALAFILNYRGKVTETKLSTTQKVVKLNKAITEVLGYGLNGTSLDKTGYEILSVLISYCKAKNIVILTLVEDETDITRVLATNAPKSKLDEVTNLVIPEEDIIESDYRLYRLTHQTKGLIGGVYLECDTECTDIQYEYIRILMDTVGVVLGHLIEISNLMSEVSRDSLTGLYNRRYLDLTIGDIVEKHVKLGDEIHITMVDIDHFKFINDTYGHPFGDVVLKDVGEYLRKRLKNRSWIARYGGEEFLVFTVKSDTQTVLTGVNEVLTDLSKLEVGDSDTKINITVSCGVARYEAGDTIQNTIKNADSALYLAKSNGRNQVIEYKGEVNE